MIHVRTRKVAPISGQYRVVGTTYEITLSKGERVPPYRGQAVFFVLVDKTKHMR